MEKGSITKKLKTMNHNIQKGIILIALILFILPKSLFSQNDDWKLVWSDEFEYTGLPDSTKWSFDTHGNSYGWGNNELQWYTDKNERCVPASKYGSCGNGLDRRYMA